MKLKCCPLCKEYLNETDVEEWCSNPECDYETSLRPLPKNFWRDDE